MTTRVYYHLRDLEVDLAQCPRWLYSEIASLHGQVTRDHPALTCLGNGQPLYVWRNQFGRYFARHYPGENSDGHSHAIATMSDEHRRQAEYSQRAASDYGFPAELEKSTGNGTRLDVAIHGTVDVGMEIQRSDLSRAKAKGRAAKSFSAGWPTAWVSDRERDPDWADHVPTARLSTRGGWSEKLPPPNTAWVIISHFTRERDKNANGGWRYVREPRRILLDDLAWQMPAGEIVPVSIGKQGRVSLAFAGAVDVIDSCTYPGASTWKPVAATPRSKEAAQVFTKGCHHDAPPGGDVACRICGRGINPIFGVTAHYDCARRAGVAP